MNFRARYLWPLAAAVLYASGNRWARRAATRGSVSAAASWAAARAINTLWGPTVSEASAAATAFATGAAIELPHSGILGAALLGYEAQRPGSEPSKRVVGAFLGSAVAFASRKPWPVPPRGGPVVPKALLPSHAEPSSDGDGMTIVFNLAAGSALEEAPTDEISAALPKADIVEIDPDAGDELHKVLDEAVDRGAVALGIAGGDGSINTAAQVALEAEKILMLIPSGTFNHLTGSLGIETIDDAIEAVRGGEAVGVDVGLIDGQVFLNTASFGAYVALVDARQRLESKIGKWPAVVVALVRVLRKAEPVEVEIDGERRSVWMAFIGNCRYHPSGFAPSWRERLDDGLLDVRYVDGTQPWARTRLVTAVLTGRLGRSRVYRQDVVKEIHVRPVDGPLRLARDGETFEGSAEFHIRKHDQRLGIYAPHRKKP